MASRKKRKTELGCFGTVIVWALSIGLCVGFIGFILGVLTLIFEKSYELFSGALLYIFKKVPLSVIVLVAYVFAVIIAYIIFRKTHRNSLSYEQIKKLARHYASEYVKTNYRFVTTIKHTVPWFNPSVVEDRTWCTLEAPVKLVPAHVSALMQNEETEWTIVAIEKDGVVKAMWLNRGIGNFNSFLQCDLNSIMEKCHQMGGYTVLRLHNNLRGSKDGRLALVPDELETNNAKECSEIACQNGINWFDFICAKGRFNQYFNQVSDSFEVKGKDLSSIIDKVDITPSMDYEMQKEYYQLGKIARVILYILLLLVLIVFFSNSF